MRLTRLVLHFKLDEADRLCLLWCSSLRTSPGIEPALEGWLRSAKGAAASRAPPPAPRVAPPAFPPRRSPASPHPRFPPGLPPPASRLRPSHARAPLTTRPGSVGAPLVAPRLPHARLHRRAFACRAAARRAWAQRPHAALAPKPSAELEPAGAPSGHGRPLPPSLPPATTVHSALWQVRARPRPRTKESESVQALCCRRPAAQRRRRWKRPSSRRRAVPSPRPRRWRWQAFSAARRPPTATRPGRLHLRLGPSEGRQQRRR